MSRVWSRIAETVVADDACAGFWLLWRIAVPLARVIEHTLETGARIAGSGQRGKPLLAVPHVRTRSTRSSSCAACPRLRQSTGLQQ